MKLFALLFFFVLIAHAAFSQNDSTKKLTFSAYGEVYYSFDFAKPTNNEKANFIYNHKRHNEVNANLLLAKANYTDEKIRANLGLMTGNYAQYNLSAEPTLMQFIYEANIGIKISKKQNIWLDAGIMPSHIGFESAVSADCWTLTRSLLAEGSPYYETGIKLSYTSKNEKFNIAALMLNGWQKIQKPNYIQKPSAGIQVNYKPMANLTLNYSNFLGTDKPDSLKAFRHFHNLYLIYEPTNKFGITAGIDLGNEKLPTGKTATWFSPVLIIKQSLNNKTKMAFRAEYYSDIDQIIVATGTANGFKTFGFSSNVDYQINEKAQLRFEAKLLQAKDNIFFNGSNNNFSLTGNLTFRL